MLLSLIAEFNVKVLAEEVVITVVITESESIYPLFSV